MSISLLYGFTSGLTCQSVDTADILQRLSPYLRRNAPLDILDLWPGAGLWSSMVNEFLQPRRHVLVESEIRKYGQFLKPLAESKPCYELIDMPKSDMTDWEDIFAKHLPEQGPPSGQELDALPKNDTLLVLAAPPAQKGIRNHITPARWWGSMMQGCLLQEQFHIYGSVRVLLSVPPTDAEDILPRFSTERRRPAIMTENVALHAWEVANPYDHDQWMTTKQLSILEMNRERVAERAAAQNVKTPAGREPPPFLLAPALPQDKSNSHPHVPRARKEWHDTLAPIQKAADETGSDMSAASRQKRVARTTAMTTLRAENTNADIRRSLTRMQMDIDYRTQNLSRAAADRGRTMEELAGLDLGLAQLKTKLASEFSAEHYRRTRGTDREIDDWRIVNESNEFDTSALLWERRPFEPLRIHPDEHYLGVARTMIYFEADANPHAVPKLQSLRKEQRSEMMGLFDAMTLAFGSSNAVSVDEVVRALLPDASTNDVVRVIPSLIPYAGKRLKPGSGAIPLEDPTLDPSRCFQENIDYDLRDVRLRSLPASVMWDILFACYERSKNLSPAQFGRLLGSTTTTSRVGHVQNMKMR